MTDNQDPVDPQEYLRRLQEEGAGQEGAGQEAPQNPYPTNPYPANPYPAPHQAGSYPGGSYPGGSYPAPGYPAMPPPEHPSATTSMVLGIIGLASIAVFCGLGLFLSPVAWAMGAKAVREIDASHGRFSGRDRANAGKITGIIGTVLLVLGLLALVVVVALAFSSSGPLEPVDTTYESDF